jgi:hypothetical protein
MNNLLQLTAEEKQSLKELADKLVKLSILYKYAAEVSPQTAPEDIKGLDCSELVEYMFARIGYKVPDGAINQYQASQEVAKPEIEVGDTVYKQKNGTIDHVALVASINPIMLIEANGWEKVYKVVATDFELFSHPRPLASQYAGARRFLLDKIKKIV